VGEAREASGGELPDALRAAIADNERLNKQLHVLHGNATQLRQAIADARSLQMHLQQLTADASESRKQCRRATLLSRASREKNPAMFNAWSS
jgi:small-conductance mechanosensitive channel